MSSTSGKERDAESGNDYFGARYYASSMGRFLSPDPSNLDYADQTNPQSLNLYSYTLNNPLKFTDPTGMYCFFGGKGDTPENDSDPTDYDFTDTKSDCHGKWIDNPSTSITVNGNTGESDSITTFPTDVNATIQRSFSRQFPCGQNASSTIANLESNFPQKADWQQGPLHVTFLQRGKLQPGGVVPIDGPVGAWAANGSPAGIGHGGTSAVSVTTVGSNSFTFTTVPGMHPFDNGTVTFSATDAGGGNIDFGVDVNAQFANKGSQFIFNNLGGSAMEASIWHNLINNVQAGCHN